MAFEVEPPDAPPGAQYLVRHDKERNTYALVIPNDPAGRAIDIGHCPWCGAKLRRVRARGLGLMTPATCRKARQALSMTHRQLADEIGEPLATVFRYEMGKPTDPAVEGKLHRFFEECPLAGDRSGRIGRYVT